MIARAIAARVPFAWVAADTVYGTGDVEMTLRRASKGYVLGADVNHPFHSWGKERRVSGTAEAIARELPESAWSRLSAGDGSKGARLHDWSYLDLADLDAQEFYARESDGLPGLWTRGLLIRRTIADGSMAFFSTWCPRGTTIETSSPWKAVVGLSRTASRRPGTSSTSTTTKRAPGTAGTDMSRWS